MAGMKFYLCLTVEKMDAFAAFTEKYLRPYGCTSTNFTTAVNSPYPKTEISQINEVEII